MILFKKIRWRNFLSTGNHFIEIEPEFVFERETATKSKNCYNEAESAEKRFGN